MWNDRMSLRGWIANLTLRHGKAESWANSLYCVIDRLTIRSGDTVYRHRANIVKTSIYSRLSRPVEQQTSTYTKTVMAVLYHKAPILYESWSLQPSTFPLFLIKRVVSCYNKRLFDSFQVFCGAVSFQVEKTNHGTKWSKSYLVVYTGTSSTADAGYCQTLMEEEEAAGWW
jgi:hypothetical protein